MTVTANLYCNLAAWSSGSYVVGNCVSASGNAYRCTTAGTAPTTPSGTSTSPTSFGAGTSQWVWLSAITFSGSTADAVFTAALAGSTASGGLTGSITQPIVWQCWNTNGATWQTSAAGTPFLTLSGHSFTPTNNFTLKFAQGESWRDNGSGNPGAFNAANGGSFTFPATTGTTNYFTITDPNVTFDGLQFKDPCSTSASTMLTIGSGANNFHLRNCVFDGFSQTSGGAIMVGTASGVTGTLFTNTTIIDRQPTNTNLGTTKDGPSSASTATFVNCTFVAINSQNSAAAIVSNGTGANSWAIRNCVSIGYALGVLAAVNNTTGYVDHCATDATQVINPSGISTNAGGNLVSQIVANMFVSATTDFRLKGGSPFINAGITDTTNIPTADDTFRTARPQDIAWCMGAFEFSKPSPWQSSHCFYSAASFSTSNKGTDTGGSVYGLTSAIFVGFPTNMNPTPGSALINAGFTDTADIPAAIDAFGTSRPQGTAWDGGAVEIIAGTTVSRDFVCSIDFQQSLPSIPNDDPIFGIEWRHAKTFDFTAAVAWAASTGSSIGGDAQIPLEILHAKTIDLGSAVEWLGSVVATTQTISDAAIGVAWTAAVQADSMASGEVLQSMPSLLSPWGQVFGPVFGIGPYSTDPSFAIEWGTGASSSGGGVFANWTVPLEWRSGVQITTAASLETNVLVARDLVAPAEWLATTAFSVDAAFVVDWRASVVADSSAPVGWLKTLAVPVNMAASLEWRVGFAVDSSAALDWRATRQVDSTAAVYWTQSIVAGTATLPLEIGRSVAADSAAPIAPLATVQRDASGLLEWGVLFVPVTVTIPVDFAAGIAARATGGADWTASLTVKSTMPLAAGASLAADGRLAMEVLRGVQADAIAPAEPGGGVAGTIGTPLEFGHLTFTIMVDGTAPLEINSLVVGGIVVPVEPGAVHLTLGAKLEPDTWEYQNQPETGGQLP